MARYTFPITVPPRILMPVSYDFDGDILALRMVGDYETSDIRAAVLQALASPQRGRLSGLLFDVSRSTALPKRPTRDIKAMAAFLARIAPEYGGRLALVGASDVNYGLMRMGAVDVEGAGVPARVFRTEVEATDWLRGRTVD